MLNALTFKNEFSRPGNLTFLLWSWILTWVPRSVTTHASLSNTLSKNSENPGSYKGLNLFIKGKTIMCILEIILL